MQAAAAPATAPGKGKKAAAGSTAAAVAQHLQLRVDALRGLAAIYDALLAHAGLLPSAHEAQAAEALVRGAAVACLARPGGAGGDRSAKAAEEALRRSCSGW